jgi:hypothetical protein
MKCQNLKTISKEKSISVFTFRKFVKMGLPHYRLGRKILIDPEEFDAWFTNHFKVCNKPCETELDRLVQDTLSKFR